MNKTMMFVTLLVSCFCSVLSVQDVKADNLTVSCTTYYNIRLNSSGCNATGIAFTHKVGATRVEFSAMSEEDKKRFGYDPVKEKEFLRTVEQRAVRQAILARAQKEAKEKKRIAIQEETTRIEILEETRQKFQIIATPYSECLSNYAMQVQDNITEIHDFLTDHESSGWTKDPGNAFEEHQDRYARRQHLLKKQLVKKKIFFVDFVKFKQEVDKILPPGYRIQLDKQIKEVFTLQEKYLEEIREICEPQTLNLAEIRVDYNVLNTPKAIEPVIDQEASKYKSRVIEQYGNKKITKTAD